MYTFLREVPKESDDLYSKIRCHQSDVINGKFVWLNIEHANQVLK